MKLPISIFIKRLKWSDYAYFAMTVFLGILVVDAKYDFGKVTTWIYFVSFAAASYYSGEIIYKAIAEKNQQKSNPHPDNSMFLKYWALGEKARKESDFEYAVQAYESALANLPNPPDEINIDSLYVTMGSCRNHLNDFQEAFNDFSKAIDIDPSSDIAYRLRAISLANMSCMDEATADMRQAASLGNKEAIDYIESLNNNVKAESKHSNKETHSLLKPTDNLEEWRNAQALLCRNAAYIFRYEKYIEMLHDDGSQTQVVEEFSRLRRELITEYYTQLEISFKYNDSYFLFRLRNLAFACMSINMNGKMNDDNEAFGEFFLYKIFGDTDTRLREVLNDEEIKKQSERANAIEEYIVYGCSTYCNKLLNLIDCGSREERDNGESYLRFLKIQAGLEQNKMFDEIYVIREAMLWTIASTNIDLVTSAEESDSFEVKAFDILSSTNQCFTDYGDGPYRREEIIDALSRKQDWISKDAGKDAQILIQDYRNELDTMSDDQLANEIHKDYSGDTRQFLNQWGNHGRVATTKEDPKERVINTEYTIEQLRQAVINDYAYLCFGDGGTQSDETSLEDFKINVASMSWDELMKETSVIESDNPKLNHPLSEYMETWLDRTIYAEMKYLKNEDGSTMLVN